MLGRSDAQRQDALLGRLGLPLRAPDLDPASLWAPLRRDKKARRASLRWVLLQRLGSAVIRPDVPESLVDETLRALTR
jgi:3-dehydroquinate synthase